MELTTATCTVTLDEQSGGLTSFRAAAAPGQEFLIPGHEDQPLFVVQYLDAQQALHEVSSREAQTVSLQRHDDGDGIRVEISYQHVGALDLAAVATVRAAVNDAAVLWDLTLTLPRAATLLNVQFPFVVVAYDLAGDRDGSRLLQPFYHGRLYHRLRPHHFPPDVADLWHMLPQNGDSAHYPGLTFAQLLAYYNEQAGLLLTCRDAGGAIKEIKPAHRDPGLRLGIAHVTGWTAPGSYTLGYSVALQGFQGDWYEAAEIYRRWALQQPWAQTPLAQRQDLPPWLVDAALHIVMRIQGEVDAGPTHTHPEFTPYENALPLLDRVAARAGGPLVPVIMSWERPGPWVYPDCFPPAGGADSLRRLTEAARDRGWHIGTYCNGTRWAIAHKWSGYQGAQFFAEQGGPESVCIQPDGRPWTALWDQSWRPSYAGCLGSARTKELLWDYAQTLLDYGLDWIQILDQNVGCSTFPCYSSQHDHPPAPGAWMTAQMEDLLVGIQQCGAGSSRDIAWSVETPCSEYFLPSFAICDIRPDVRTDFVPLYYYLYHDYIMIQSMFAAAPNPYFLVLKFARSFILGEVMGCHMGAGGRLQNWEPPGRSEPWMEWDRPAGDQDAAYAVLRNAATLRRRVGKDFLVFGRMLRPVAVRGVRRVAWTHEDEANDVPAVENATWQAPDGRVAVALANWTGQEQPATVDLTPFGGQPATLHLCHDGAVTASSRATGQPAALALPPHACALLIMS